jgi:hypothetical protein
MAARNRRRNGRRHGGRGPARPGISWSKSRSRAFGAALAAAAVAIGSVPAAAVAALAAEAPAAARILGCGAATAALLAPLGAVLLRIAARPLSEDLVYVCRADGSVELHMRPGAFGVAGGTGAAGRRHVQAIRLLRAVRAIAASEHGPVSPDLVVAMTSRLCERRLMERLGFRPTPTPGWKVAVLRAAFAAMAVAAALRGRRVRFGRGGNWRTTWTARVGDLPARIT